MSCRWPVLLLLLGSLTGSALAQDELSSRSTPDALSDVKQALRSRSLPDPKSIDAFLTERGFIRMPKPVGSKDFVHAKSAFGQVPVKDSKAELRFADMTAPFEVFCPKESPVADPKLMRMSTFFTSPGVPSFCGGPASTGQAGGANERLETLKRLRVQAAELKARSTELYQGLTGSPEDQVHVELANALFKLAGRLLERQAKLFQGDGQELRAPVLDQEIAAQIEKLRSKENERLMKPEIAERVVRELQGKAFLRQPPDPIVVHGMLSSHMDFAVIPDAYKGDADLVKRLSTQEYAEKMQQAGIAVEARGAPGRYCFRLVFITLAAYDIVLSPDHQGALVIDDRSRTDITVRDRNVGEPVGYQFNAPMDDAKTDVRLLEIIQGLKVPMKNLGPITHEKLVEMLRSGEAKPAQ